MILRPYQSTLKAKVQHAWAQGARNVLMRLDTGGGKTVIFSSLIQEHPGYSCLIAHRHELVGQISLALARQGIRHNIIAAQATRRAIVAEHLIMFGTSFYDPGARCAVASVDTLIKAEGLEAFFAQVTLWIVDEAHHVVVDNKWHTCIARFTHPACVGLGPTATPRRADGKGLGAHADGVFHTMVQGPPMRWLIDNAYLSDYEIVCPESDLQVLADVGANGDWSPTQLRDAAKRSHIVGDVVRDYLKFAAGRLGVTFSTDVETATEMAQAYQKAGVRAEVLTGKTEGGWRRQMLKQFARREILQIVAVDVISEGYDLPAIEVASFARPTQSLGLYMQQHRHLRPVYAPGFDLEMVAGRFAAMAASGKTKALTIDHVANVIRHQGPPDKPRVWTLDRRDKRAGGGGDGIALRICVAPLCLKPFERFHTACPYCGEPVPPPVSRSAPAAVDGDLVMLDADTLARLRGEVLEAQMPLETYQEWLISRHVNAGIYSTQTANHVARQQAQGVLRLAMAEFGGRQRAAGRSDREIQKAFWLAFDVDVLTAQTLGRADAVALTEKVRSHHG